MAIPEAERKELLRLARAAVAAEVARRAMPFGPGLTAEGPALPEPAGVLGEKRGCFVTLTNAGRLRGCIGTFHPQVPLAAQVVEMGRAAARDYRFAYEPITPAELPALTVQVSVLSELTPIADPLDIELGVHGIYIIRGGSAGCFLPEVATETGWSKEEFLSHCCAGKAGMSADAWKDPKTKVLVFTSEKFAE